MNELIDIWEKRVKHYKAIINSSSCGWNATERLYATVDTLEICIAELKLTLNADKSGIHPVKRL